MTSKVNHQDQSAQSGPNYFAALRFVLLPLALLILANIVFSLVAFNIDQLVAELKSLLISEQKLINPFLEARARLTWGTTVLLFYSALIAVSIFCGAIIRQSLTGPKKLIFVAVATLIAAGVLGHLAYSGYFRTKFSYIFFFTFDTLTASQYYTDFQLRAIKGLVSGINVLTSMVASLALVTGCCLLSETPELKKSDVYLAVNQMRQLKMFIGMVSTLLVTGVLHMVAWLHWPSALVLNKPLANHVISFSESMALYWGATFSLLIATFYIPAAWSISKRAAALIAAAPEQTQGLESQEWLKKHSLSLNPLEQLPELIAMLAPLLVGPIGAAITRLSGPLSGG
ncbi:MAG: hypothetical protein PHW74_12715 [Desulfobacca sp.]|nr:hypothetical protein [Desulfobacca sp.]